MFNSVSSQGFHTLDMAVRTASFTYIYNKFILSKTVDTHVNIT